MNEQLMKYMSHFPSLETILRNDRKVVHARHLKTSESDTLDFLRSVFRRYLSRSSGELHLCDQETTVIPFKSGAVMAFPHEEIISIVASSQLPHVQLYGDIFAAVTADGEMIVASENDGMVLNIGHQEVSPFIAEMSRVLQY